MRPFALHVLFAAALMAPCAAHATAGYFQLGYGMKSKGMGGASAAYAQDAMVAATNPAGMVWAGNRLDVGAEWFAADRGSRIAGNLLGLDGDRDANGRKAQLVPELGFNRMLGADRSLGVALYGNGGTTRYDDNPLAVLGGTNPAGMEFIQAVAAPTLAMKLGADHSVGIALNLIWQRLTARGFEHFDDPIFSVAPGRVTNQGRDKSRGVGLRVGWMGRVAPTLTLGAAYQPRVHMRKFERYRGLLADRGNFDVPPNAVFGVAWQAMPALTVAADVQRILFARVPSLGNRSDCFLQVSCPLGAASGPGSGWRNATVVKLGVAWQAAPTVTLRGGLAHLKSPIESSQTLLNLFAPAVSENHLTLGATWQATRDLELTLAWQRAFEVTVRGRNSIPPGFIPGGVGGGEADLRMQQRSLGLALGWKM